MRKLLFVFYFCFLSCWLSAVSYPKLPVFDLKYNTSFGTEEDEELGELLTDSIKHNIVFNIKEEISRDFYFNFPLQYTLLHYFVDGNDYYYIKCSPYLSYNVSDLTNIKFYLAAKWLDYSLLDAANLSKDYFYVDGKLQVSHKLMEQLKLNTYFKCAFDLYENPAKIMQSYNFQLDLEAKINQLTFSGAYNGKIRLPMGDASLRSLNFLNSFTLNLELDPNKANK